MRTETREPLWRLILLVALAGWAALLSLESWFRPGGFLTKAGLPERLERDGLIWQRRSSTTVPSGPLPEGVVLLEQADYLPVSTGAQTLTRPIHLRRLSLTTSGTGVDLPVEAIGPALLGAGGKGRCVVLDARGAIVTELPTGEAWAAWIAPQRPTRYEILSWLAGLRPFRANGCLWESLPR